VVQSKSCKWTFALVQSAHTLPAYMDNHIRRRTLRIGGLLTSVLAAGAGVVALQDRPPSQSRVAIAQTLPVLDGRHLEASIVEVTYEPGGAGTPHRHPCPVIGYMLEGSMRMQVSGQSPRTYNVGDTFYESPTDTHLVSANASADKPARFLAYFVCDQKTPLSVPAAGATGGR
jgi:quercetin dioxygenase-like cupin family protein